VSGICAQHGYVDVPDAKFCSQCGNVLEHHCPTCGQEWNGAKSPEVAAQKSEPKKPASASSSSAKKSSAVNVKDPKLTGLMYGIDYQSAKDCINCGCAGQSGRVCKLCGFEG